MIGKNISWQYKIVSRQTIPIVVGLLGCLALMMSFGYFYAREAILNNASAQVKQFVSSIKRQDEYSRKLLVRSMPALVQTLEQHLRTSPSQLKQMDAQICNAISNGRGEQLLQLIYIQDQKLLTRFYTSKGVVDKHKAQTTFTVPPSLTDITHIKQAHWSAPYVDKDRTIYIRYTVPLKDKDGKTFGILISSLAIPWFTERIRALTFSSQCIPFFLTANGHWTLNQKADISLAALKMHMYKNDNGITTVTWQKRRYVVVYMPSGENNLLMGVLIPRRDLFGSLDSTATGLILISIVILLLATYALHSTNENFRTLLYQLLEMTDQLAKGNFDRTKHHLTLTPVTNTEETTQLYKAIERLRRALHQRVHDLTVMTKTRERLHGELRFARNIQNSLRPINMPKHPNLTVDAFVHEAREVCGDMYNCFSLSKHEICCIIGNVVQHGFPAALLTNRIMPLLHELILAGFSPAKALAHVNRVFESDESTKNLVVSAFVCILDLQNGLLTWASAGQLPPYVLREGTRATSYFQLPHANNPSLGMHSDAVYVQKSLYLQEGESLLFIPQRLLCLPNPLGEQYGEKRLDSFLQQSPCIPRILLNNLFNDVLAHMKRVLRDDMVLFALRWKEKK